MTIDTLPSEPDRNKAMDRYDSHMNRHGHYSMKGLKSSNQRSHILDEILRSGQTLASDYAERMGMPDATLKVDTFTPEVDEAIQKVDNTIEPEAQIVDKTSVVYLQSEVDRLEVEFIKLKRADPSYDKVYKQLTRAETKLKKALA